MHEMEFSKWKIPCWTFFLGVGEAAHHHHREGQLRRRAQLASLTQQKERFIFPSKIADAEDVNNAVDKTTRKKSFLKKHFKTVRFRSSP